VIALERLGCDVQLGMALYTGKVSLKDGFIGCLDWGKGDLVPVVAQADTGEVLMVGYANRAAFGKTFETGKLTFWSRSRNTLWTKGATSGNTLDVVRLRADCDRDTVLATVRPAGPACHTGSWTCFKSVADRPYSLPYLSSIIADRFANPKPGSYTATLTAERVREKIMEEAEELTEADGKDEVVWECADLLYFVNVLMDHESVSWQDILDELDRRHKK
jgi:phosphoribosyl-AMP cyclohydrolase / phosphoribosyl-ATP pyrophosphohydrolase